MVAALFAYSIGSFLLPGNATTVFSGDIGVKYLQTASLAAGHGWLDQTDPKVDPEGRWGVVRPPFATRSDGKTYSVYLNPVTWLAAPIYRAFGLAGVGVIPLLAVLAVVGISYRLAAALEMKVPALAGLAVLAASPVWFYGYVFWEHAPATALTSAALLTLTCSLAKPRKRSCLIAGILLGVAASCRPEAAVFTVAVGLAYGFVARRPALVLVLWAGGLGTALTLAWLLPGPELADTIATLSAKLGTSITGDLGSTLTKRANIAERLLIGSLPTLGGEHLAWANRLALAVLLVLSALSAGRRSPNSPARKALLAAALVFAALAATAPIVGLAADRTTLLLGLFSTCPLLLVAVPELFQFLRGPTESRRPDVRGQPSAKGNAPDRLRFVAASAVLFVGASLATAQNDGGNQWGARYLLPITPVLVILAMRRFEMDLSILLANRRRPLATSGSRSYRFADQPLPTAATACGAVAVSAVLILSLVVQGLGLWGHVGMRERKAEGFAAVVNSPARVVASPLWFLGQEGAAVSLSANKHFLTLGSRADLEMALRAFIAAGESHFVWIERSSPNHTPRNWLGYGDQHIGRLYIHPFDLDVFEFRRSKASQQ